MDTTHQYRQPLRIAGISRLEFSRHLTCFAGRYPMFILFVIGLGITLVNAFPAKAQLRPTIIDSGQVKETAQKASFDRSHIGSARATRASNGVLVILTDPKTAEVRIDGRAYPKLADGKFRQELPIGKPYKVAVSAGDDFVTFQQTVHLQRGEPTIVEAAMPYKYGVIKIFPAMDGVTLLMDDKPLAADKFQVDKSTQLITIDRVDSGDHSVTYDLPGYAVYQRKFHIDPGVTESWNFIPERAIGQIALETDPGTSVYLDGQQVGTTPTDGKLSIPGNVGAHSLKLAKDGFEEFTQPLDLKFKETLAVNKKMVPLPTSAEFSDDFNFANASKWTMPPSGWSIKDGRLHISNSSSVGYATKITYRGFSMNFDLKLENSAGASWVVRMKDSGDYYLFYLSGPKGRFPNSFVTYIVRNNAFNPEAPFNTSPVVVKVGDNAEYHVEITANQNTINTFITPADTGVRTPLGSFTDPDNTFPYGGIGFRTVGAEKFSIDDLFVEPR